MLKSSERPYRDVTTILPSLLLERCTELASALTYATQVIGKQSGKHDPPGPEGPTAASSPPGPSLTKTGLPPLLPMSRPPGPQVLPGLPSSRIAASPWPPLPYPYPYLYLFPFLSTSMSTNMIIYTISMVTKSSWIIRESMCTMNSLL